MIRYILAFEYRNGTVQIEHGDKYRIYQSLDKARRYKETYQATHILKVSFLNGVATAEVVE